MRETTPLPTLSAIKDQARRLRARLEADGQTVSHSKSLELVASQHGFRDWNTLAAALGNRPGIETLRPGMRVSGAYLGQRFTGRLLGIELLNARSDRIRVTLDFDEPVDVVTFPSFSSFRKRVTGTIGEDGMSRERTSNGLPQLELAW